MLEEIRKKYQIDYSVNENLNYTKIDKLLNQVYLNQNIHLLKEIQKREDFSKAFTDMFKSPLTRNYDFLRQPYELLEESVKLIKQLNIELKPEELALMLIENHDKRVKVFLLESGLLDLKINFSEKETQKLLKSIFSSANWEINLDLLMQIHSFEEHAKNGSPTALALFFKMDSITYPSEMIKHLNDHNIGWGKSGPKEATTLYLNYLRKQDNTFNQTTFNVIFNNILNFPGIKEEKNIVEFLRKELSRFEVEAEIVEKGLSQLEKEVLENITLMSEKVKKIKL